MSRPHEYFERLAGIERSGTLTKPESQELLQHLQTCESCRLMADQYDTVALLMTVAGRKYHPDRVPPDLIRRLKSIGSGNLESPKRSSTAIISVIAAILVFVAASFLVWRGIGGTRREPLRLPEQAKPHPLEAIQDSAAPLQNIAAQLASRTEELHSVQRSLQESVQKVQELEGRIASLESSNQQLQADLGSRQGELDKLKTELKDVSSKEDADHVAASISEIEVSRLRQNEAKLNDDLQEAKRIQALLTDAQQMIVDRDMHTFYVYDDKPGKEHHPFGRIFYSKGKVFKFYAWDLGDVSKNKESFYLWGETQTSNQQVVNLGQFHIDSVPDDRWLLKVDPRLLTQVTSVFVTREKGVTENQPAGERMLSREIKPVRQ